MLIKAWIFYSMVYFLILFSFDNIIEIYHDFLEIELCIIKEINACYLKILKNALIHIFDAYSIIKH